MDNPATNKEICDVCSRQHPVKLASSSLGPVSLLYCNECMDEGAEPLQMIATTIMTSGGIEDFDREALKYTKTFDAGEYRTLDYAIALYPEIEAEVRSAFFGDE